MVHRKRRMRGSQAPISVSAETKSSLTFRTLMGVAAIGIAILIVYAPALHGGLLLDDAQLSRNSLVKAPDGLYRIWCTTEAVDYWPVTNTTFWLGWHLWGNNVTCDHVVNLLLHFLDALLIWLVLSRVGIPGAFFAALLFAIHPVNVESVAWISQRKNLLALFFALLSVLWYLNSDVFQTPGDVPSGRAAPARHFRWRWYGVSLAAFLLAMLSKGSVAILPLELLLIIWWLRGKIDGADALRLAPFFLIAVVLTAVNVWFQTHGATDTALRNIPFVQRLLGAAGTVWFYLGKVLLPINLVFVYPQWNIDPRQLLWWLSLIMAVLVTVALIWRRNSKTKLVRPILFAWLFFCIALLPVMGFVDVGFMKHSLVADHYEHLAIIGILALVAAGGSVCLQRMNQRAVPPILMAEVVMIGVFGFLAREQAYLYVDQATLYRDALGKNPDSSFLQCNVGQLFADSGHFAESIPYYQRAILLNPNYAEAHCNLGIALFQTQHLQDALEHLETALQLKPDFPDALNNFGIALASEGKLQEAMMQFQKALRLYPGSAVSHFNMGNALALGDQFDEAATAYEGAVQSQPDFLPALVGLVQTYLRLNEFDKAIATAQRARETARRQGQTDQVRQIDTWLQSYEASHTKK
jgi:protein O-mannosyl-transferase